MNRKVTVIGSGNVGATAARSIADKACALEFSWTLDCERVLAGGVLR